MGLDKIALIVTVAMKLHNICVNARIITSESLGVDLMTGSSDIGYTVDESSTVVLNRPRFSHLTGAPICDFISDWDIPREGDPDVVQSSRHFHFRNANMTNGKRLQLTHRIWENPALRHPRRSR